MTLLGKWVLDASLGVINGAFAFCPVELDADGNIESVVTGLTFVGEKPPHGNIIAVVHHDGQEAVEAFCAEHQDAIDAMHQAIPVTSREMDRG